MSGFRGKVTALGVSFIFLLWANLATPLWADDYCRIVPGGIKEYILLSWREYFAWTGRFFATAMTYFVLGTGQAASMVWFDVVNAVIFLGLIVLVLHLGRVASGTDMQVRRDFVTEVVDTLFVGLLLWWIPRDIAEVALWKTGSIGYLWPMAGELLVLTRMLPNARQPHLWLLPAAFLVATFLEPLSLSMSAVLCGLAMIPRRAGRRVPIAVALAHAAGTVFLLIAPGNFVRAALSDSSPHLDRVLGVIGNVGSLFDGYWIPAVAVVALPFFVPKQAVRTLATRLARSSELPDGEGGPRQAVGRVLRAGYGWVFVVLAVAYMLTLLGLPRSALAARVSFPASVFLVCYLVSVWQSRPISRAHNTIVLSAVAILLAVHCAVVFPHLTALERISREWSRELRSQAPGSDAVLPLMRVNGRIILARKDQFFGGLSPDPAYFINACYAKAMGMRSVTAR